MGFVEPPHSCCAMLMSCWGGSFIVPWLQRSCAGRKWCWQFDSTNATYALHTTNMNWTQTKTWQRRISVQIHAPTRECILAECQSHLVQLSQNSSYNTVIFQHQYLYIHVTCIPQVVASLVHVVWVNAGVVLSCSSPPLEALCSCIALQPPPIFKNKCPDDEMKLIMLGWSIVQYIILYWVEQTYQSFG